MASSLITDDTTRARHKIVAPEVVSLTEKTKRYSRNYIAVKLAEMLVLPPSLLAGHATAQPVEVRNALEQSSYLMEGAKLPSLAAKRSEWTSGNGKPPQGNLAKRLKEKGLRLDDKSASFHR